MYKRDPSRQEEYFHGFLVHARLLTGHWRGLPARGQGPLVVVSGNRAASRYGHESHRSFNAARLRDWRGQIGFDSQV